MLSLAADKHVALLNEYIPVDNSDSLRINFDAKFTGTPQSDAFALFVHQYDTNKNEINNIYGNIFTADNHADIVYHLQQTRTLTKTTKYIRIEWVAWGGHGSGTLFISNVSLSNGKNTLSGQIGVLKDNINFKVDKNDVINQINVSTEGILIDGQKTHITNHTTIDNAVITSAMIKDINADTITTGTLNAANVNIVNLDVNRLTGNRGDFISAGFHDACHDLELTGGGITATFQDWSKMTLNTYGLQWRDKDGDPVGSITTEDWLLKNGIADTLLIGAYGGRQISFGLATESNEHLVETAFNLRRLDTSTRKDEITIELPNPYKTQICIGSVAAEHEYLRLENYAMNNFSYPYITGDSRNAGMFIGQSELYFRRTNGDGDAEVLSLGDIEYGKLKGLSNGRDRVEITSVRFSGNDYFALLSPGGQTGIFWGTGRLYFVLEGITYPLADILRGATWDI